MTNSVMHISDRKIQGIIISLVHCYQYCCLVATQNNRNQCGSCHARDNQSHPRPKLSPSRLVPLSLRPLQVAEITHVSLLRNPYVIPHHLASPQPNLEHYETLPEQTQLHASNLAISPARPGLRRSTRLLEISLSPFYCHFTIFSSFPFMYIIVLVSALPLSYSCIVP